MVQEPGLLEQWPAKGLKILWQRDLGAGFSGISVVDGVLFTAFGEGKDEYCTAIDASSGRELWRQRLGPIILEGIPGAGPRATPVVVAGWVYAMGSHGDVWAFEADTGRSRWHVDLRGDLGGRMPMYGYAASPVIYEDLLLLVSGSEDGRSLVALDRRTGEVLWATGDDRAAYATPVVATLAGRRQAVFFTARGVVGTDLEWGTVLWRAPWETTDDANAASPIVTDDHVFVSSNAGGLLVKIEATDEGSGFEARQVWETYELENDYATSLLWRDHLYGVTGSMLTCLGLGDEKPRWQKSGFQLASVLGLNERVLIALNYSCELVVVALDPTEFREQGRFTPFPGRRCLTAPTVAGGRLYIRNEQKIMALDLRPPP